MPHDAARLCHHDRASHPDGHCSECHPRPIPDAEDEVICRSYHARQSRCLLCGDTFQSYDPRYNRRCPPCQTRVANTNALAEDEHNFRV